MKKILLIAVSALVAVSAFAQNKFAHVNFSELVQLCPDADEARVKMSAASTEAQETYQAMVEEFQTKYQQYESKASTWSDSIRASKEKELQEIQGRIQEFGQSVDAELQQQQQTLMAPIQKKASEVVNLQRPAHIFMCLMSIACSTMMRHKVPILPRRQERLSIFRRDVHLRLFRQNFKHNKRMWNSFF